ALLSPCAMKMAVGHGCSQETLKRLASKVWGHSEMSSIRKIGILGAGRAGTAIARAAARAGVDTQIASTRSPSQMKYHLLQYAPSATAVYAHDIAADVDVVVLVVPQEDLDDVSPDWVGEGILVDATNRWEDEPLPEWFTTALNSGLSSSEVIAQQFPRTRVVKAS